MIYTVPLIEKRKLKHPGNKSPSQEYKYKSVGINKLTELSNRIQWKRD